MSLSEPNNYEKETHTHQFPAVVFAQYFSWLTRNLSIQSGTVGRCQSGPDGSEFSSMPSNAIKASVVQCIYLQNYYNLPLLRISRPIIHQDQAEWRRRNYRWTSGTSIASASRHRGTMYVYQRWHHYSLHRVITILKVCKLDYCFITIRQRRYYCE